MLLLRPNPTPPAPHAGPAAHAAPPHTPRGWFRAVIRTARSPGAIPAAQHQPPTPSYQHPSSTPASQDSTQSHFFQFVRDYKPAPPSPPSPPSNPPSPSSVPTAGNRLNLLLSWAPWRSESWVTSLPRLLEPMGVNSVRVSTAREAEKVIRTVNVHIAVVDLSLPLDDDGSGRTPEEAGPRVLEFLRRLESPPPTVIVQEHRTARDSARHMSAALRCDAFAVVDRAAADLEQMLKLMHRCMDRFYHGRWPTDPNNTP